MSTERYAVGIDLGGTNVKLLAVAETGTLLHEDSFSTDVGPAAWVNTIAEHLRMLEGRLRAGPAWVGLAAPGLAAADERSVSWMQGRLQGLQDLDWTRELHSPNPVRVLNDAHAALMGEVWQGAAAGSQNVVLLTLGTGVGGAILCDGRLLRGQIGRAGHLGHITLDAHGAPDLVNTPGSLEDAVGECTLSQRSGGRFDTTRDLLAAMDAGDAEADRIWDTSLRRLAAGIASISNAVDPEYVVLAGGVSEAGDVLYHPLERFLGEMEWRPGGHRVRIVPAKLGRLAGAYGAAYYAMRRTDPRRQRKRD